MSCEKHEGATATAIISQKVLPGRERKYEKWQEDVNAAAADYAGYLGVEVTRPTGLQPEWVVVYRFDSVAHVQAWINSATRARLLDGDDRYLDGPGTQQVVSGGGRPTDPLVTVVVTHRVDPAQVDEFLAWPRPGSPTSEPGPTGPRPTAPCSTNGPMPAPTAPNRNDATPSPPGCTPTITTADTPRRKANHPPPASPTSQGNAPSAA